MNCPPDGLAINVSIKGPAWALLPNNYGCHETRPDDQPQAPLWSPPCPGRSLPATVIPGGQRMDPSIYPGSRLTLVQAQGPPGSEGLVSQFPSRLQPARWACMAEGGSAVSSLARTPSSPSVCLQPQVGRSQILSFLLKGCDSSLLPGEQSPRPRSA